MTDAQVFVKPRPGLILAEVPAEGGPIPEALASEWIANRIVSPATPEPVIRRRLGAVVRPASTAIVGESGPETVIPSAPANRRGRPRKAATAAKKRRSRK